MKILAVVFAAVVIVLAAALLPVRPYLDFQLIFHANLGLLRGISLYDHSGQVSMIAQLAQVSPERVYVLPFPYPPWYALSTLWLATMPIHTAAPYAHAGKMRMLAVMSAERSPVFPAVPTFAEAGFPNFQVDVWYGLLAPAGTPAEVIAQLNAEVNAMLAQPAVRETLAKQGLNPMGGPASRLADVIRQELDRWPRVVAAAGIKSD